jgi:hypothetical protein
LFDFTYDDADPWPVAADGAGYSLQVINPLGNLSDPSNWKASAEYGGTPGTTGAPTTPIPVAAPVTAPVTQKPVATSAPVGLRTQAPVLPPTKAPVTPPSQTIVDPPTQAPILPPTKAPVTPSSRHFWFWRWLCAFGLRWFC